MIAKTLKKLISIQDDEVRAVLLATAYGFCIFLSYYMLRAVRDEISSADRGNLQFLWTGTFLAMLVAVPLYSAAVARFSRGVFIPLANRFFASNLLIFFLLLQLLPSSARPWIDRAFYIWAAVFALFVVTVFWGFMVDLFKNEQGKRLFGFIAMGSSLGGIVGSAVIAVIAESVPVFALLLIAIVPLELASWCAYFLHRDSRLASSATREEEAQPIGGSALHGMRVVFQSPYLRHIALFLALMTFASTVLYFQQAELIRDAFLDNRPGRTAFYAKIDMATNILTIFTQAFVAAHVLRLIGIGLSLALVPAVALLGFFSLAVYPLLGVLVVLQVVYRAGRYSIARPAREVLFTVVDREDKYKAKSFIDAGVYRGGDLVSGWVYAGLAWIGLSLGAIALVAVPLAAVWLAVGLSLGRKHEKLVENRL